MEAASLTPNIFLRRALDSAKAAVRARAFDLVYNLSLHAELLYPLQSAPYDIHSQVNKPANPGFKDLCWHGCDLSGFCTFQRSLRLHLKESPKLCMRTHLI